MHFSKLTLSLLLVDLLEPKSHQLNRYDFAFFRGVGQALMVLGFFKFVLLGEFLVLLDHFSDNLGGISTDLTCLFVFP